jgi:hypothetical protein
MPDVTDAGHGPGAKQRAAATIGLLVPNDEAVGSTDRAGIEELVAGRLRPDSEFAEGCGVAGRARGLR